MPTSELSEEINHQRRRLVGAPAVTIAAAQIGMSRAANAQPGKTKPADLPMITPGTNTSFAAMK